MILKGKKVILRPIKMSDAPRFVKWFNDPDVHKFLNYRSLTLKQEKQFIAERIKHKPKDRLQLCIDAVDGTHVGTVALEGISHEQKRAGFGIVIGDKRYWNKGLGTEATKIILDYGFKKLKLHRIELDVYSYNPRAIKVYKKLGFKLEGKKREHAYWKGKFYTAYLMGILNREWKNK